MYEQVNKVMKEMNLMGPVAQAVPRPVQAQTRSMAEVRSIVKIRSNFKQKAFELGKFNRVVLPKRMPVDLGKGELVEIAVMSMLGRVSSFYDTYYNEPLDVTFDYWKDITKKIDLSINNIDMDLTSRFTHDKTYIQKSVPLDVHVVSVFYDFPGIVNLMTVLQEINMLRPLPNQLIKDINYLWELYMSHSVTRDEQIYYNHAMNEELDDMLLYMDRFPEIKEYPNYRNIIYMYTEDPNESDVYNGYDEQEGTESIEYVNVDTVDLVPEPTPEEIEAKRKYQDQLVRLGNHLTQKGIDGNNLFHKFKLDPYKSFSIEDESTFISLLRDTFPQITHKIEFYTFNKVAKGGEFKLSYDAIHNKISTTFPTPEDVNTNITVEWVNENIYEGVLSEHFKNSLYNFVKFINPDAVKWHIVNIPKEEFRDIDRKAMMDELIEHLGLNSNVIKLVSPTLFKNEIIGAILCDYYGEIELFELIKKRLVDMKK